MIFLSKKQLIPSLILLNVILLPCILPLLIFFLIYQEMRFLLVQDCSYHFMLWD